MRMDAFASLIFITARHNMEPTDFESRVSKGLLPSRCSCRYSSYDISNKQERETSETTNSYHVAATIVL